ncbi:Ergothioneine biosynthesis protein 1 [Golovinomyces cichoracearum]|uniref:Ergothioneine biosynthesis protein 1 n=1 Tax=Golovinomyces cichoracearum TaxID=62708 RepID=A0A420HMF6_9PEZI|nr:Ergothioneine biosynthesis protein 1 [Golovinomyces cichoracearum]
MASALLSKCCIEEENGSPISITDIRQNIPNFDLKKELLKYLKITDGPRSLPTILLYNERGLQLFEEITYLDEYYLTNAEVDILKRSISDITSTMRSGSLILELGSGNLRKTTILLEALEKEEKIIDYYALDLSFKELYRTLDQLPSFRYVRCHGLHGTYEDGLQWFRKNVKSSCSRYVMSLGSSLGNYKHQEASELLTKISDVLQPCDYILLGLDQTNDGSKVFHAYNGENREGLTHKFILNALNNANEILENQVFNLADWKVIGKYIHDEDGGRHEAFLTPIRDFYYDGKLLIKAGEPTEIERSLKFSCEETANLWKESRIIEFKRWTSESESYSLYLLKKDQKVFEAKTELNSISSLPTLEDWRALWQIWDKITRDMIAEISLHQKPIKYRNPIIFYLGHVPTFLDMQIQKMTKSSIESQYSYFTEIFERGIDPDVENPEKCHRHSVIPESWPPVEMILNYQSKVRAKIEQFYKTQNIPRQIARAIWLGFEHEILHAETLLYMLLQSDNTLPPTESFPDFGADAEKAKNSRVPNQWFHIPNQRVAIGLDDPEDDPDSDGPFGWDNEKPSRSVEVAAFQAQGRPLTNYEYGLYLQQTHKSKIPASWAFNREFSLHKNGFLDESSSERNKKCPNSDLINSDELSGENIENRYVRTVYGLIPLKYALDWPVWASYNELADCAQWMNARIPTFEEARSIYAFVEEQRSKGSKPKKGTFPVVNNSSHTNGDHVIRKNCNNSSSDSHQNLFASLDRANVGFKNWHPVAVTSHGDRLSGQAEMGGVWEWTSTTLKEFEGFQPMSLYPEYTADFFDGKHNIMLGGSWATHPRVAGRKSFINWYQRDYPYAWAGVRLVRDIQ